MSSNNCDDAPSSGSEMRPCCELDGKPSLKGRNKSGGGIYNSLCRLKCCFAHSLCCEKKEQETSLVYSSSSDEDEPRMSPKPYVNRNIPTNAIMPVDKDAKDYNLNHGKRGVAIILYHTDYDDKMKLPRREGTDHDISRLKKTLENNLQFDVRIFPNYKLSEILTLLESVRREDHTDNDCFLLVCMTHGWKRGVLSAYDKKYKVEQLVLPFLADACPQLAGKPKLFFIQACRGEKLDEGVNMIPFLQTDCGDNSKASSSSAGYMIPKTADTLVMFATTEGYAAWTTPRGAPFIQHLCEQLDINAYVEELQSILTTVKRKVCIEYQSKFKGDENLDRKKCMPQIAHNSLIRNIKFRQKTDASFQKPAFS